MATLRRSTAALAALTLLSLSSLTSAAPLNKKQQVSGLTTSPEDVQGKTFDYVVVGGGLAGLVVAGRLSEDEDVSVLVIEAGGDDRTDARVYDIANYGQFYGTELDWSWETTSGKRIGGGRTLGGSSSINGAHYTRGEAAQYDAWSTLLNDSDSGWGWDQMFEHMKKSEHFFEPNDAQTAAGAQYVADYHGSSGPLEVTFPQYMYNGPGQPNFVEVLTSAFDMVHSPDLNGGNASVVAYTLSMLNPNSNYERSSSATTYLGPVENIRTNLLVLTNHQATSITTSNSSGSVVATGVKFKGSSDGQEYEVSVGREVVVSAGAIQSPALLQHSGIGPASVLEAAGVDLVLDVPGVGRNLNEQTSTVSGFTPADGVGFDGSGPSDCIAFPSFDILFPDDAEAVKTNLSNSISRYAADAFAAGAVVSQEAGEALFEVQRKLIVDGQVGLAELFFDSGFPNGGFGLDTWGLLPFARGTVEIISSDPFAYPKVDPRYFGADFDYAVQINAMKLGRKIFQTSPLSDIVSGENTPGTDTVPDDSTGGSTEAWKSWIDDTFGSVSHPISTCAMMSQANGGVVGADLKVHGTSNIRVADASVLPMQVSAHLSATIYGVGEMAADLIKASHSA